MFLCLQVNAQQRRKAVPQRRTTTSVKKNNPQAIKKTRKVGEDGFIYSRETEYIKVIGIAECFGNKFTMDVHYWNFAEVVVKRKKFI